ncbi:cell-division control histidine kinase PdhS [Brucella gallinifaecis]|uniref:Cell-division control histidine kinase PdhS n=1 Tax=Brucella gallinifaecis TaxID=215590 RepID=A0A502BRJ5_9HYPH|nr:cell-division control histidine kinase PdhS [Brucella gallinifaecis]TPF76875.1 PAS domain S-box protein [Brucella gallinifaecis]
MSGSYPFIDIAALDHIREGFARGDAQLVLTRDLSKVLWINGPGARLFGFEHIEDIIGSELELPVTMRRQITDSSTEINGASRIVSVRLNAGLRSELVRLHVSSITMPDGVEALLLASEKEASPPEAIIAGFGSETTHIAMLDAKTQMISASKRFAMLDIALSTLEDLIIETHDAPERIVKRRIRAGKKSVPGAITRLTDNPAIYLICILEETLTPVDTKTPASAPALAAVIQDNAPVTPKNFVFDPTGAPARFIWKIDAAGMFTEVSPELGNIIGPNAADIIGRRFTEVANVFGFDASGDIAELLEQRSTWSGKKLLWPVEGTSLRVPVELAALPVYSRNREFVGFRGFGLVRPQDAEDDPEAIGMVLAGGQPLKREAAPTVQEMLSADDDDDILALSEEIANDDHPEARRNETDSPTLPFELTPNPGRRESDKVIELLNAAARGKVEADHAKQHKKEHRPEGGLTATERNAFREIADRLRKQGLANAHQENEASVEDVSHPKPTAERIEHVTLVSEAPSSDEHAIKDAGSAQKQHTDETALLASLPIPVIIHSGDVIHYINQALLDRTGYRALPEIQEAGGIAALFNSNIDDGDKSESMVLRHANGSEEPVEAHLNAINWRNGRALMLSLLPRANNPALSEVENTTSQETQALQGHIEELKTILDTATDGVVLIDPEGRMRSMNHSAAALFGYDQAETKGKFFSMLFAIESQRAAMDYLHSLSDNGVLSVLNDGREVIGREAQGGLIPLFMTMGKLPHTNGYCAVLRDITQWKRTEEELTNARREAERASSQKTEFLARISHEIRTPLNAIIGFSELMSDEKFGPIGNERYRDYLRDINRSGNHVLALVNDLLDISKIEAGALDMQFEAVSLNDAIDEAIALMQPQANRERIIIRSSFQSNLPDIVADARSIKQVALNLLSNAVRFTATGGQVIVSTNYELNGDVVMRVRDTGIGMTKAEIEQALKPFRQVNTLQRRQAESAKDWRNEGTGLGLPLTKAMVEANRAQFAIDSTPGQGTVVEIIFPPTRVLAQ